MNRFGKLALVMSTLSPVMGAYACRAIFLGNLKWAGWYAGLGFLISAVSLLLLWLCKHRIEREVLHLKKTKCADKESLTFLLVYLLPILDTSKTGVTGDWLTVTYIFIVIGLVVAFSNSVTFNPVLAVMGYHFYEFETIKGASGILLTKAVIKKQNQQLDVIEISPFFYLDAGNEKNESSDVLRN